jgi:hypothetical protein
MARSRQCRNANISASNGSPNRGTTTARGEREDSIRTKDSFQTNTRPSDGP